MGADQLDLQLKYQIFHLGVYVSLATALIGASVFLKPETQAVSASRKLVAAAILFLILAGACGGIATAKIPQSDSYDLYLATRIGIAFNGYEEFPLWLPKTWESLEHAFFWLSMGCLSAYGIWASLSPTAPPPNAATTSSQASPSIVANAHSQAGPDALTALLVALVRGLTKQ